MKIENGSFCPFIKKDCIGLKCTMFIKMRGVNPNTGAEVDEWDCTLKWLPVLLIENAKEVRQGAAATESFRNEVIKAKQDDLRVEAARLASTPTFTRLIDASNNH